MAVSNAIRDGRLSKSVGRDDYGNPKIEDPELADREWDLNTDAQKRANAAGGVLLPLASSAPTAPAAPAVTPAPAESDGETQFTAAARLKKAQADMAELKRDEARGLLVPAADVQRKVSEKYRAAKTRLLALPSAVKQAIPRLTPAEVEQIDTLVREALTDLADDVVEGA